MKSIVRYKNALCNLSCNRNCKNNTNMCTYKHPEDDMDPRRVWVNRGSSDTKRFIQYKMYDCMNKMCPFAEWPQLCVDLHPDEQPYPQNLLADERDSKECIIAIRDRMEERYTLWKEWRREQRYEEMQRRQSSSTPMYHSESAYSTGDHFSGHSPYFHTQHAQYPQPSQYPQPQQRPPPPPPQYLQPDYQSTPPPPLQYPPPSVQYPSDGRSACVYDVGYDLNYTPIYPNVQIAGPGIEYHVEQFFSEVQRSTYPIQAPAAYGTYS